MPNVLITGASRGIGREFVRQYAARGWRVVAGVRDARSFATEDASEKQAVVTVALDVADPASIAAAAGKVSEPLDLLLVNAGVYGPKPGGIGGIDYTAWQQVMGVNVLGAMRTLEAFLPHLRRGAGKTIAAISSIMGSIGINGTNVTNSDGGAYVYRSSKAALNMVVSSLAIDLKDEGFRVVALHPGWVQTDMGGASATVTPAQSVTGLRSVIAGLKPEDSGRFYDFSGKALPW